MAVAPHTHISGLTGVINALYTIAVFGALILAARHFKGHPFADAFINIYSGREE